MTHKQGATTLAGYTYGYDGMSRLTSVTSTIEGLSSYSYDATSQVTLADHAAGGQADESYGYDLNGNRNTSGYTTTTNNRTTAQPGFTFTYDDQGNRTSRTETATGKVTEYSWDHRNRLSTVKDRNSAGGSVVKQVDYAYDAFNRLVKRTFDADGAGAGAATHQFWAYDEGINAVLQFDGPAASNLSHRYLWSDRVDELLADETVGTGADTLYALGDHLGTIRDIANFNESTSVTSVTNHRTYNSFGKLVSETNAAVDLLFGYTGKQLDEATGLQHNLFRWYDSALGQWLSEDPLGFAAGDENLKRYVGNRATLRIDPSGLIDDNMPNWHHLLPQEWRKLYGDNIDHAWNGWFLRAGDHRELHSAGWNDDWVSWTEKFREVKLRDPKLSEAKEFMKELMAEPKYTDILDRGFKAGWSHAIWLEKSGRVKQQIGALLAKKLAAVTGSVVARKTGKGILASIPFVSIAFSLHDYPARASEFGTNGAIGMTVLDNIPIVDIALATAEGIDAVQQARLTAETEAARAQMAMLNELMREARDAGLANNGED